jgi:hypothetical protein
MLCPYSCLLLRLAGLNQYSDMSMDELMSTILNLKVPSSPVVTDTSSSGRRLLQSYPPTPPLPPPSTQPLPLSYDWRGRGVLTGVKNQLSCGSCWAHASVTVGLDIFQHCACSQQLWSTKSTAWTFLATSLCSRKQLRPRGPEQQFMFSTVPFCVAALLHHFGS